MSHIVSTDLSTPCKPAFLTHYRKRRNGWKANTVTVQCQHGHAYGVIQPGEWAGSRWEAYASQYTIITID